MELQTVGVELPFARTHHHSNYRLVPAAERCCLDPNRSQLSARGFPLEWTVQYGVYRREVCGALSDSTLLCTTLRLRFSTNADTLQILTNFADVLPRTKIFQPAGRFGSNYIDI